MKRNYLVKNLVLIFILFQGIQFSGAQNLSRSLWSQLENGQTSVADRSWYPKNYQTFSLQTAALKTYLLNVPMETAGNMRRSSFIIDLPMPDGNFQQYALVESPVMEAGLAAAYPSIKTYAGRGIDDPTATIRCDVTQFGFHSYVLSANGTVYIDPLEFGNTDNYLVYYKSDIPVELYRLNCDINSLEERSELNSAHDRIYQPTSTQAIGTQLRTYRLALAADGEYTAFYGGTRAGALAGMVTTMNRVNGLFERELDIRLNLVPNDTLLIYTNATTDPYTNSSGITMLTQNQTTCNNVIGSANYDMGHVFSTGGGGIAGLGVICTTNKAKGVTGLSSPIGDPFDVDFVCHEMGHQFGAEHTFNVNTGGSCAGNVDPSSAYEPGSGSTIMAYAGICSSTDNLLSQGDPYFHTRSFDQIVAYSQTGGGSTCPVTTSTGNNAPVLTMPPLAFTIPYQTPFSLTATATDPENDPVTFCWEEYDIGPNGSWTAPTGNAPIFRSFLPVTSGTRLFPKLSKIITPASVDVGETMPTYSRSLKFRCTARDGVGGVIHSASPVVLTVINTTVPFAITAPNGTGVFWAAGSTQTVTWNVASTDMAPINAANVNIYLSINNGTSFPIVIATGVPNNGSYSFSVPSNQSPNCRIKVEAAGNIFFDINDKTFTITAPVGVNEMDINNYINMYPNPATTDFHFVLNTKTAGSCRITLNDMAGRTVKEIRFEKQQGITDRIIHVSDVAKGMYIVRFVMPEGIAERKFIRE